jgi:endo-1,4-beta-D-glucanase Y
MFIRHCCLVGLGLLGALAPLSAKAQMGFPYNVNYPSGMNNVAKDQVRAVSLLNTHWAAWKSRITANGAGMNAKRVLYDPAHPTATSSEGQGYGMIMAVYFADQDTFDRLYQYVITHRTPINTGLMCWLLDANGNPITANMSRGDWAATDGDEDIAFSLIAAASKWGKSSNATFNFDYMSEAKNIANNLMLHCVSYAAPNNFIFSSADHGANTSPDYNNNPSYYSPAWYRLFEEATGDTNWSQVIDRSFKTLWLSSQMGTKLIPNWCKVDGSKSDGHDDYYYGYESFRVPWRCGIDYSWNGNSNSLLYSRLVGDFYQNMDPLGIKASRNLDGSIWYFSPGSTNNGNYEDLCFLAGASNGLHSGTNFTAAQNFYEALSNISNKRSLPRDTEYYQASWQILSELFITGNLPDPRTWNQLINADFEQNGGDYSRTINNWDKWSDTNTQAASYAEKANGNHKGSFHLTHYSIGSHRVLTSHRKTMLTTGLYTARAWVKSGGGFAAAEFQVKNYGGAIKTFPIPTTNAWTMVKIENIYVANGECTVGFWTVDATGKRWMSADDVTLIRQ